MKLNRDLVSLMSAGAVVAGSVLSTGCLIFSEKARQAYIAELNDPNRAGVVGGLDEYERRTIDGRVLGMHSDAAYQRGDFRRGAGFGLLGALNDLDNEINERRRRNALQQQQTDALKRIERNQERDEIGDNKVENGRRIQISRENIFTSNLGEIRPEDLPFDRESGIVYTCVVYQRYDKSRVTAPSESNLGFRGIVRSGDKISIGDIHTSIWTNKKVTGLRTVVLDELGNREYATELNTDPYGLNINPSEIIAARLKPGVKTIEFYHGSDLLKRVPNIIVIP